ncbi:hypothetical protein ACJEIK_18260 [Mycobacterium sp. SMC-16]|uniref:hypothetical protein n=1 Tax=Mycobacterium sp. SMC-16 TaxID=3385967 RepID=UPI00390C7394
MTTRQMLPLYEGKMGHAFDHRFGTFVGIEDTDIQPNHDHSTESSVLPRYWVRPESADERQKRRTWGTDLAMLGFRRVARNTDERTCIAAILPWGAASYGWILSAGPSVQELAFLCAQYNSFIFDFVLRQFLSQPSIPQGTFEQLPTIPPNHARTVPFGASTAFDWIVHRSVEISATDKVLAPYAEASGESGAPFVWDEDRRELLRAELDAAFLHLFEIPRDDAGYVLDSFDLVLRRDFAKHGEYRTKRLILDAYDQLAG